MAAGGAPRLVIYSQDGLGLGHLRRTTLLASEFLQSHAGACALTVSDSPLGQFFSMTPGHDYLKLPSIRKAGPGDWRPVSLLAPFGDVLAMRRDTIRSAVLGFNPDILLVDHMPHGAMGELVPALEELKRRGVRMVLGLRDILDAPSVIRTRWKLEGAFEAVEQFYDQVLVYGRRDVYDVAAEYEWPAAARDKLRYCGYVCAPPAPAPAAQRIRARHERAHPGRPLVLVMAGGGADAYELFDAVLDAVPAVHAERGCHVVLVTGPFLPAAQRRDLARRARPLPVQLLTTVSDSLSYMQAADALVAMAGYNTTSEILSVGKPALLVPRQGPSAEQRTRAELFAERGWVRWLPYEQLGDGTLAGALLSLLDGAGPDEDLPAPDLRGRFVAAQHLLGHHEPAGGDASASAIGAPRRPPEQARDPAVLRVRK
jgi:predicted glycosyltransferase